ncbi:hypothetical protein K2X92_03445, partial [Candidatus Gracilibacteria bacterium]|nr:hypothetical protein [Candidatus Gracilibacteria bacterium]
MALDTLHLETSGKGEKIEQTVARQKLQEIQDVKTYLAKIAQPGKTHNPKLQQEVVAFIEQAANNKLGNPSLDKYNAKKFDTDGESGLDQFEFENFTEAMKLAIQQIVGLDGLKSFDRVHSESKDTTFSWDSKDKWAAEKFNFSKLLTNENGSSFTEEYLKKENSLSPEELHKIQQKPFSFTNESIQDMKLLLKKELGSGVEDMMKFMLNVGAGVILFFGGTYGKYRSMTYSSDLSIKTEGEIKLAELVENNPSLGIIELVGEKGIQLIKQIVNMLTSGKQGDIASSLVMLVSLAAGGWGAVRIASNMARRSAVKAAREAGSAGRKTGEVMSRESRNTLKKISTTAGKIENAANTVDNIISGNAVLGKVASVAGKGVRKVAPAFSVAANDAGRTASTAPVQHEIQFDSNVIGEPKLAKQLPRTNICSGINLQGMLDWAYQGFGKDRPTLPSFGDKKFSPQGFVDEFNKNAPPGYVMRVQNPSNQEVISIINSKLKEGTPVPMIYVPIGGNVKAPHFATIVDTGKLPDGTPIYRIQDSMRDVIPKEWLTEAELLKSLNFETLRSDQPITNLALRTVATVAQKYLGGNTIYTVEKIEGQSIIRGIGNAANDASMNITELEKARAKRQETQRVNAIANSELRATGTNGPITGPRMFLDNTINNRASEIQLGQSGYQEGISSQNRISSGASTVDGRSTRQKIEQAHARSLVDPIEVRNNAGLSKEDRIKKAQEIISRELTPKESQAIDYIHTNISKGIYKNSTADLMKMARVWEKETGNSMKDKFKFAEFRKLVENGILGHNTMELPTRTIAEVARTPINRLVPGLSYELNGRIVTIERTDIVNQSVYFIGYEKPVPLGQINDLIENRTMVIRNVSNINPHGLDIGTPLLVNGARFTIEKIDLVNNVVYVSGRSEPIPLGSMNSLINDGKVHIDKNGVQKQPHQNSNEQPSKSYPIPDFKEEFGYLTTYNIENHHSNLRRIDDLIRATESKIETANFDLKYYEPYKSQEGMMKSSYESAQSKIFENEARKQYLLQLKKELQTEHDRSQKDMTDRIAQAANDRINTEIQVGKIHDIGSNRIYAFDTKIGEFKKRISDIKMPDQRGIGMMDAAEKQKLTNLGDEIKQQIEAIELSKKELLKAYEHNKNPEIAEARDATLRILEDRFQKLNSIQEQILKKNELIKQAERQNSVLLDSIAEMNRKRFSPENLAKLTETLNEKRKLLEGARSNIGN